MVDFIQKSMNIHILEDDQNYLNLITGKLKHAAISDIILHKTCKGMLGSNLSSADIIIIDTDFLEEECSRLNYEKNFRKLKELATNSKIIILSSKTDAQVIITLFKIGIVDYIIKNNEALDSLEECVDQIIDYCQLNKRYAKAEVSKQQTLNKLIVNIIAFIAIVVLIILFKTLLVDS